MSTIKKENGLRTFLMVLKKNFFKLVVLNLFFLITCIPVITIGPACRALSKVTMDLVRDRCMTPGMDYFKEFKTNFLSTALAGCAFTSLLAVMIYAIVINFNTPDLDTMMQVMLALSVAVVLYILAMIMYALNLFATIDLSTAQTWKNAVLLVFMSPKQMLIILLTVIVPAGVYIMIFDVGVTLFIAGYFTFASLICSINAWTIIKKYVAEEFKEDAVVQVEESEKKKNKE